MAKSPRTGQLFLGMKFWVSHQVPGRKELLKSLQHHGALILSTESEDSCNLINPEKNKSSTASKCYSYKFVLDCFNEKQLLDESEYEVHALHSANRVAGSTSTLQKSTRTKFTPEDDQLLFDYVEACRLDGGRIGGNKIYEEFAKKHPHHTFQSWRDRYLKILQPQGNKKMTVCIQPDNRTTNEFLDRPAKRIRLDDNPALDDDQSKPIVNQSTAVDLVEKQLDHRLQRFITPQRNSHSKQPESRSASHGIREASLRSDHDEDLSADRSLFCTPEPKTHRALPHDRYLETSISHQGFNYNEADRLYAAVPDICNTSPEKLKGGWAAMAQEWSRHSVGQWKRYYTDHILPEYKRANGLETQEELEAHVASVEKQKNLSNSPEDGTNHSITSEHHGVDGNRGPKTPTIAPPDFDANHKDDEIIHNGISYARTVRNADDQASLGANSKSSATQRVGVTANEESPTSTPLSQKKKLFGRVLELSGIISQTQSSFATQLETKRVQINETSSAPTQSNIISMGKTDATSSSTSLPTVHKPPQSFQIPPRSVSTSQESAKCNAALQTQGASTKQSEELVLPEQIVHANANDEIDLLDGERTDSEVDVIEHPLSDTGSEYMAFETGIERSQMWETESQFDGERTEPSDNEEPQHDPAYKHRSATPARQYSPAERTEDSDNETDNVAVTSETRKYVVQHHQARIETQALFNRATQQELSIFDLPDPDGGWETLGIIKDPDEAVETVELPDDHALKRRRFSFDGSLDAPDDVHKSPVVTVHAQVPVHEPSNGLEDDTLNRNTRAAPAVHVKAEGDRLEKPTHEVSRFASGTPGSVSRQSVSTLNPEFSMMSASRFGRSGTVAAWMASEQAKYPKLPEMVFKRLASTASQAVNLNSIDIATLLLESLVDNFLADEHRRQAEYKQRNPGTRKRLKQTTSLSSAQAKTMLPNDVRGVWTPEDDNRLTSLTRVSIMLNEIKHGKEGASERINFLRSRYNIRDGSEKTPGPSLSKRRS